MCHLLYSWCLYLTATMWSWYCYPYMCIHIYTHIYIYIWSIDSFILPTNLMTDKSPLWQVGSIKLKTKSQSQNITSSVWHPLHVKHPFFLFLKCIGVTLVSKIEQTASVHFYSTWSISCTVCPAVLFFLILFMILERKKGRERQRNTALLFHLFIHSQIVSCMCPDQGLNPPPWHIGMMS